MVHFAMKRGASKSLGGVKLKRTLGFKAIANVVVWIMLAGGVVFTAGFGLCLMIARQEVTKEADAKVRAQINYLRAYVDGQLQRIEDASYSLASAMFGNCVRDENGNSSVGLDPRTFVLPSPEDCYVKMQKSMEANPIVCGIAIEFERDVYPEVKSAYGFTPYVTRLSGEFKRLDLGTITDSFTWEWYTAPTESGKACWISPFRDSSLGHVIACFTIPVYKEGKKFAVMAVDIDTESFGAKCDEISPYPSARVTMLDRSFNFISHPDKSCLMRNVKDVAVERNFTFDDETKAAMEAAGSGRIRFGSEGRDELIYFASVERAGWTISIRCPEVAVYGGVSRMKFTTTVIAVLSVLAMVVCLLLVFRNLQNVIAKEAGIENELTVASAIQQDMLPKLNLSSLVAKELDIYGFQKSAKSVGGDLYDFFVRNGKLFFCIGDVSGKGVPAALYMAVVLSLFRGLGHLKDSPEEILRLINHTVSEGNTSNMFCTFFLGVLDLDTGHLEYCNGGHNPPLIRRVGPTDDFHFVKTKVNVPVGALEEFPYRGGSADLNPGDVVLLYTDGVTEAEDVGKNLFGETALREAFASAVRNPTSGVRGYVEWICDSVAVHTSGAEQSDDITMLAFSYLGNGKAGNI